VGLPARTFALAAALLFGGATVVSACGPAGNDRWVTTENTNVEIDWDKIKSAYTDAEGPEDFERRVNEIYEGDEVVSVAVRDLDDRTQVVTGFFDTNKSGAVDEGEQIFTIQRDLTGEGSGTYQMQGHGHRAAPSHPLRNGNTAHRAEDGAHRRGARAVHRSRTVHYDPLLRRGTPQ
jgi:hypothetical protein